MKVSKERILPVFIGAFPVILVLLLVAFVSASGPRGAPAAQHSPPGYTMSIPGTSSQPATGQTSQTGSSSSGGSSPLCLPFVGCLS